jgi:hypothetical protein
MTSRNGFLRTPSVGKQLIRLQSQCGLERASTPELMLSQLSGHFLGFRMAFRMEVSREVEIERKGLVF